ncbi:MAG TPA: hypothetical protein ENG56_01395 [Candidatus Aenigmarchaeota archaeon]|nr:hypothetical protein [Candidatus Aenigmarchaeota archaeon]
MINIDRLCAEIGFLIPREDVDVDASKQENAIRKALAILSQEGIFAYLIYLESEGGNIMWDTRKKEIGDDEKSHRLITFYSAKLLNKLNKLNLPGDFFEPENEKIELLLTGAEDRTNPDPLWNQLTKNLRDELTKSGSILEDIHQIFFVKQILEQMLTYALYRARSLRQG